MFLAMNLSFLNSIHFIFYVILGLAVLAGLIRGFKKTVYAFIVMVIFYVVFFLTIDAATNALWTMNLPFLAPILGNIDPAFSNFTSFEGSLNNFIDVFIGGSISLDQSSEAVTALATGLLQFVLKLVWTILYFTVILLLWKIITWIIGAIFLKNKDKASKNRGFGALFGVLNGAMAIFVAMIMLGGFMSVAESALVLINSTDTQPLTASWTPSNTPFDGSVSIIEMADTGSGLNTYVGELQTMVDSYNNDIFVKIADKITTQSSINNTVEVPLHIDLFDRVLSFKYEDQVIGIRYELGVFSSAASVLVGSDFMDTNNISDITGDEIRDVFGALSESKLIVTLMPVAIEVGADMFDQTLPITVDELYAIDYEQELANLGNIAGALFDILNGAGFIGGSGSLDQLTVDGDTVREIFGDMADSEVIVLLTENLLLPMLSDSEGDFATIITVPTDLDVEAEITALGDIFGEIIDADIPFSDLEGADVSVLLDAASQVDLTVLLDSKLVSEALINILSGQTTVEGLDVLTIPADVNWYDTVNATTGALETPGELRNILEALNALTSMANDVDLANLDINVLTDMDNADIEKFFNSYVIRATVSDIISGTDLGDVPLVIPDSVYDSEGYFTKTELVNVVKAIKLILTDAGDNFDILQALNLTSGEIDTLLASDIISATIGSELYDLGNDTLVIPDSTLTQVMVDSVNQDVVGPSEIKSILQALAVLDIQSFDSISFDATIFNSLENNTQDGLDDAKINTLLGSEIIHATVSDMIIGLDEANGGVLTIPAMDSFGATVEYTDTANSLEMISKTEIGNVLKALYGIDITNFDSINLEDTSLLMNNMDLLTDSGIIHATISKIMLDISGTITIPEKNFADEDVLITSGTTEFIAKDELIHLMDALNVLGITNPANFTSGFNLGALDTSAKQDQILDSAIVHATISKTILDLDSSILYVPDQDQAGTALKVDRGSGTITTYVVPTELKAMINVFNALDLDLNQLTLSFTTGDLLDQTTLIVESASLQAQISDRILNGSSDIVVPDKNDALEDIKIPYTDVTYIRKTELVAFLNSVNSVDGLDDFSTFSFSPSALSSLDLTNFFASKIMHATVSKFILNQAGTENPGSYGTTVLLVPTDQRETFALNGGTGTQIEEQELIYIIEALNTLGMGNFDSGVDATGITSKTSSEINDVLRSVSFHVTIDNMLRANTDIVSDIPALAEVSGGAHGVDPLTTADEITNLIVAMNTIGATDFQNDSITLAQIGGLNLTQRQTVLQSMIVRNKFTPDLEAAAALDPGYSFTAGDYNSDPVQPFLTYTAALDAVNYFYPLP